MTVNYKQIKASLTPAQQAFVKQKKLSGEFSPGRLMKLLSKVSQFDRLGDARRGKLNRIAGWCFGLSFVALIVSIFVLAATEGKYPALLIFSPFLLLASVAIGAKIWSKLLDTHNINNCVRLFVLPITAIFREDIARGGKLKVNILGDDPLQNKYFTKKIPRTSSYGREYHIYHHPWFSGEVTLLDGVQVSFDVRRQVQKIKIKKRSSRGKTKFKTKYKLLDVLQLSARVPKSHYRLAEQSEPPFVSEERESSYLLKSKVKSKQNHFAPPDYKLFIKQMQNFYSGLERVSHG